MVCPPLRCDKDEERSRAARLPDYPQILPSVNGVRDKRRAIAARDPVC